MKTKASRLVRNIIENKTSIDEKLNSCEPKLDSEWTRLEKKDKIAFFRKKQIR